MRFREESLAVIRRRLAELRDNTYGSALKTLDRFEILETPHFNSPFLTLAEWPQKQGQKIPLWVLKVLMVLDEDPAFDSWKQILEWEHERFKTELSGDLSDHLDVGRLPFPLARSHNWEPPVQLRKVGPIRRLELFEAAEPSTGSSIKLTYLERPYLPWPTLRDVGYSEQQLQQKWRVFCSQEGYSEKLEENREMFRHFCEEALVGPDDTLIRTSGWRYRLWQKPGRKNRFL